MRALNLLRGVMLMLLLVTVACGRDAPPAQDAPTDSVAPADTAAATPSPDGPAAVDDAPAPSANGWTSGVVQAEPQLTSTMPLPVVRAIRSGAHDGFDRVTIELESEGLPGYHAEYVDRPLHQCGSGNEVFPVGDAWLEIRLEPAQAHTEQGAPTLPGREIDATADLLRRIYVTCDFEGVVSLVLALAAPNPFQVRTLRAPARIVVDVRR